MTAFRASFRYELRMQLRKPSLWVTMGALAAFLAVTPGTTRTLLNNGNAEWAMVYAARVVTVLMPVGFGCLLADRLVRDDQLNVRQVLDATPGGAGGRLGGKYLGACLGAGVPILAAYLLLTIVYSLEHRNFGALRYAPIVIVAVLAPALLFVGAFAMLCPLVMPAPLFRVLFVGYWAWTNFVDPAQLPTLNRTVVNPFSGYVTDAFFPAAYTGWAGEVPGATLNFLRPAPNTATAWLSLLVLLALAALALSGARVLLARKESA